MLHVASRGRWRCAKMHYLRWCTVAARGELLPLWWLFVHVISVVIDRRSSLMVKLADIFPTNSLFPRAGWSAITVTFAPRPCREIRGNAFAAMNIFTRGNTSSQCPWVWCLFPCCIISMQWHLHSLWHSKIQVRFSCVDWSSAVIQQVFQTVTSLLLRDVLWKLHLPSSIACNCMATSTI